MENHSLIYLNVKTVPAFDTENLCPHTAFTVYLQKDGNLLLASGWTLQDAITMFANKHKCNRMDIRTKRPFRRQ
jgi:hypothetical protein